MYQIIFYQDHSGNSEVENYFINLSNKKNKDKDSKIKFEKFILLTQFVKKTQKTPQKEIEKAQRYLKDYKRRSEQNE